jgi:cysteinyl-tRNA synthetase
MFLSKSLTKIFSRCYSKWIQPTGTDTGIKIYSCVQNKKVPLIISNPEFCTWYSCGPTVYGKKRRGISIIIIKTSFPDSAHIGHASSYVKLDILQRVLRNYFNINLVTAMNITDIDDKIIQRGKETGKNWKNLAQQYEDEFWKDMKKLNVKMPNLIVRVSDNMPKIIEFIQKLLKEDLAYTTKDGSVYFKVEKYGKYGKLIQLPTDFDQKKHAIKQSVADFVLWKAAKEGEPSWNIDNSNAGRPGWHIECSAMASKLFGQHIVFHTGGSDLKFPHHENEEAQSCAFHKSEQWVDYWVHTGHLGLQGDANKMSKSLNNTKSISELLEIHSANEFRIFCLLSNYRSSMVFGDDSMAVATGALRKINSFISDTKAYVEGQKKLVNYDAEKIIAALKKAREDFDSALKDDFNTAKAMNSLFHLIQYANKVMNHPTTMSMECLSSDVAIFQAAANFVIDNLELFGLDLNNILDLKSNNGNVDMDNMIHDLVSIRNVIRMDAGNTKNKDLYKICDQIRDTLNRHGIDIQDYQQNSSWTYSQKREK